MSTESTLHNYLEAISEHDLISPQQEIELAQRITKGSEIALHQLCQANLRLVVRIAKQFSNMGVTLQELIAEGNLGLMKAAYRFQPGHGAKFSSYAAWWIKQAMRRSIAEHNRIVRVPTQSILRLQKIKSASQALERELGREPTPEQVAQRAGVSRRMVISTRINVDTASVSLEAERPDAEKLRFGDSLADDASPDPELILECKEAFSLIRKIFEEELNERERDIITQRFGLDGAPPRTLEEVSSTMPCTRERVRQIQINALAKIRRRLQGCDLHTLLTDGLSLN